MARKTTKQPKPTGPSWRAHIDADERSLARVAEATVVPVQVVPQRSLLAEKADAAKADLLSEWLAGKAGTTKSNSQRALDEFARWSGHKTIPAALTDLWGLDGPSAHAAVLRWRVDQLADGLAPQTVNRRVSAVRSLCKFARIAGRCSWALEIDQLPEPEPDANEGVGLEGAQTLLDGLNARVKSTAKTAEHEYALRDRALFSLLLLAGLRRFEAAQLRWPESIDLRSTPARIHVRRKKRVSAEWVPITDTVATALRSYVGARSAHPPGGLFLSRKGAALSMRGVNDVVERVSEALGQRTAPHALRHTAATIAQNELGDVRTTAQFLGHRNDATAWRYDDERKKRGYVGSQAVERAVNRQSVR